MDTPVKRKGSRKTVTTPNIEALGTERLAEVLMDLAEQQPAVKRRLRLELAARVGPEDLAAEVAKRLAAFETRRSRIHWRRYRDTVRELDLQRSMISGPMADKKPALSLDMLWRLIALAPQVLGLADDSRGELKALFRSAIDDLAAIATRALPVPDVLADQVFDTLKADDDGISDSLVEALVPALGAAGGAHLRNRLEGALAANPRARPGQRDAWRHGLRVLADARGDVDAYIATYPGSDLSQPSVGAPIARRLLRAGRTIEAVAALERSAPPSGFGGSAQAPSPSAVLWEEAWLDALEADGQATRAQDLRWRAFETRLDAQRLRAFLDRQPDFEDIEWEDKALAHARAFPSAPKALNFYLAWPSLAEAANLIMTRTREIDGGDIALLDPAAGALETRRPLAATLLRRAMIADVLRFARRDHYGDLDRWMDENASLAAEIKDWKGLETHEDFARRVAGIRRR